MESPLWLTVVLGRQTLLHPVRLGGWQPVWVHKKHTRTFVGGQAHILEQFLPDLNWVNCTPAWQGNRHCVGQGVHGVGRGIDGSTSTLLVWCGPKVQQGSTTLPCIYSKRGRGR